MDKLFVRKDVYDELIEKGFGKRDYSKLTKKVITDKNGHRRTVFVKNDVTQTTQKQPKTQELSEEKRAKYEEMLEKVKRGPEENALFVRDKGMLNKKDAVAHLKGKLNSSRSQQKEKESYEYNRDIRDFYDRTGLKGGMYEAVARNEAAKEERKEDKLKAGNRDDSMFKENDSIEFSRYGKILNGEIQSVRKDYKGNVSLLVHAEDNKDYWIEASDVTKHDSKSKADKKENVQNENKSNSLDSFLDSLGWDERKRGAAIKSLTERKIKTKKGEMSPKDFVDTIVKDDGLNGVSRTRLDADGWSYILKQYDFDDMVLYQYAKFIKEKTDLEKFKKTYSGKTITNPIQIDYRLRDFAKVNKIEEDKIWKNVGGIKNLDNIKFSKDGGNVILNYKNGEKAILNKDGKKTVNSAAKETKNKPTQDDMKENYLDAKNEAGKDISEENTINTLSKTIEFTPEETNAIQSAADSIGYKPGKEGALINELSKINKDIYHNLLEKNQKTWDKSGKSPKTFSGFDLIQEKIKSMNIKANPVSNKFANMSGKDIVSNHISDLPMGRSVNTKSDLLNNIKSELNYLDYLKQNGSAAFNENKYNLLTAAKNNIDEVSKELKLEDK